MDTLTIAAWLGTRIGPGRMKQATAAREIGVNQSMVNRWLHGEAVPEPQNCRRLARLFGEAETTVLAMAGHLSDANGPLPERSVADLATELAARLREHEAGRRGPSTPGAFHERPSAGTIDRTGLYRRMERVVASSPADVFALVERWDSTMPETEYVILTIDGDWLSPAFTDGQDILITRPGQEEDGQCVLAATGQRICVGWLIIDGQRRLLDVAGGATIPLDKATILAVITDRLVGMSRRAEKAPKP